MYFYFLKKFKIILELSSLDPFQLFSYGLGYFMIHVVHVVRKTMQTRPILHIQQFGLAVQLCILFGPARLVLRCLEPSGYMPPANPNSQATSGTNVIKEFNWMWFIFNHVHLNKVSYDKSCPANQNLVWLKNITIWQIYALTKLGTIS